MQKLEDMGITAKNALARAAQPFFHGRTSRVMLCLTIVAGCALFSANAKGACDRPGKASSAAALMEKRPFQILGLSQPAQTNLEDDDNDSIVGLWHVKFLSGGQLFDEGFDQFHSDGTEILNDTAPPQPANGAGTVCLGVFKKTGPSTYKLQHPFWIFDANGILAGTGVFLEEIVVDKEGKTFSGTFSFFTYDLSGAVTSQATGDLRGERITVD